MTIRNSPIWSFLLVLSTVLYVYRIPILGFNVSFFRFLYVLWLMVLAKDILFSNIRWRSTYFLYIFLFCSIAVLNGFDLLRMSNTNRYARDIAGHLINLSLVGLIVIYFDNEQKIDRLIRAFSLCSLVALAISIFSVITGRIPFEETLRTDRTQFVGETQFTIFSHGLLRWSSSFYDPNFYGLYLCLVVAFCIYIIYFNRAIGIYKGILATAVVALIFTTSRTSFVGLAVILLVTLLKIRRSWGLIGSFAICALFAFALLVLLGDGTRIEGGVIARITDPESVVDRFNYIRHGLEAFDRNFLFGGGTESLVSDTSANASAHLVYLSWLAKYGIVGFTLYSIFLFYPLVYVWAFGKRLRAKYRYLITAVYLPLIVMYLAYDYFAFLEFQYLVFGLTYSIILNRIGLLPNPPPGASAVGAGIEVSKGTACAES